MKDNCNLNENKEAKPKEKNGEMAEHNQNQMKLFRSQSCQMIAAGKKSLPDKWWEGKGFRNK